jgi:DNA-binding beta-propeller fold protein YncE
MTSVMDSSNNPQNAVQPVSSGELGHYDAAVNQLYVNNGGAGFIPSARALFNPQSLCVDTNTHLLFVSDGGNSRILVFPLDSGDNPTTTTASYVLGQRNANIDPAGLVTQTISASSMGTTSSGVFIAIACDSANDRLFVSDSVNNRVMVFNVASGAIATNEAATYFIGQTTSTGNTPATSQTGLNGPVGLAYDAANTRLFVADSNNNRVLMFVVPTATNLTGMSASIVLGQSGFSSNNSGATAQLMNGPWSVAYDTANTRLFVVDYNNNRVTMFPAAVGTLATNESATIFLGQSSSTGHGSGSGANKMNAPNDASYDAVNNRLFVVDSGNYRVTMFPAAVGTLATNESYSITLGTGVSPANMGQEATQASLYPYGVSFDSISNYLFVADGGNNRVMVFPASTGSLTSNENANYAYGHTDSSGNPKYTATMPDNNPDSCNTYNPHTAVIDTANNRMFISDWGDYLSWTMMRVAVVPLNSNNLTSIGCASYILGWSDFYTMTISSSVTANTFGPIAGLLAYDSVNQRLFVSDPSNNRVMVFSVSSITNNENATYFIGQTSSSGNAANTTQSGLNLPGPLAYDSTNARLFVADINNNRIMVFSVPSATNLTGINAVGVLGQSAYNTNASATSQSGLYLNKNQAGANELRLNGNMDYDVTGQRLFVPDIANNRVLVFSVPVGFTNGENASNVLGQSGYNSSAPATTHNGLGLPSGVTYDKINGRLFVADGGFTPSTSNCRIMIFDASATGISNGENAEAVIGQPTFTSHNCYVNDGFSGNGYSINGFYNSANNTYFDVQYYPDRIFQFNMIKIVTTSLPAGYTSQVYKQQIVVTAAQGTNQTYSIFSGSLPAGLTLNSSTGLISGTPSGTGSSTFTVEADDNFSNGSVFFDRVTYTISVPS